ncbi:hypothetical protein ACHAXA_002813 [Cyclostephanos tholiformis]|uniref:CS domain-containing protein n=1 Tax=Cyclostephanos tholiformis TaxID=382380 RepID=A0ABD3R2K2_9STRA
MSRLDEYSKFDRIDSDTDDCESAVDDHDHNDDDGGGGGAPAVRNGVRETPMHACAAPSVDVPSRGGTTTKHPTIADRYVFSHGGRKVYEWEQSLDEVNMYIDAPMDQLPNRNPASYIVVDIATNGLRVGLRGGDRYFIDEETYDKVKVKESSWYLDKEEGVIAIVLSKCHRGQTWEGVLCGHRVDAGGGVEGDCDGRISSTDDKNHHRVGGGGIRESIDPLTKREMQRALMLERFQEENPGFDFRDATFNGEVPDPRTFMGGVGYNNL